MKNVTPNQLAYFIAVILGLACFIVNLLLIFFFQLTIEWYWAFVMAFATSVVAYILFYIALERFIYRKIKLIYKHIHRLKQPKKNVGESVDLNENILDQVETQVLEWTAEKKEEVDALKKLENYRREFLGNVSHELKTPIFNMQGYLHTLIDGGIDDHKINMKYLHRAAQNAERLSAIVNDLEIVSRHEAGELQLNQAPFNIAELVEEIFEAMEMMADANDVELSFKKGSQTSMMVFADRERIHQVLTNLISNSIHYGSENGKTKIGIYDMDKYALIEVTDNGLGIAEKHLPRLFERFYRVDPARSREKGGSGLGLSIVKHLIEAHHQTIHVRSKEGLGTTFGFTLAKAKA
ncbi:MAG: ATP-binding protein [Chitinophagales bacterium]